SAPAEEGREDQERKQRDQEADAKRRMGADEAEQRNGGWQGVEAQHRADRGAGYRGERRRKEKAPAARTEPAREPLPKPPAFGHADGDRDQHDEERAKAKRDGGMRFGERYQWERVGQRTHAEENRNAAPQRRARDVGDQLEVAAGDALRQAARRRPRRTWRSPAEE